MKKIVSIALLVVLSLTLSIVPAFARSRSQGISHEDIQVLERLGIDLSTASAGEIHAKAEAIERLVYSMKEYAEVKYLTAKARQEEAKAAQMELKLRQQELQMSLARDKFLSREEIQRRKEIIKEEKDRRKVAESERRAWEKRHGKTLPGQAEKSTGSALDTLLQGLAREVVKGF